jgi:hypothetical protein
MTLQSHGFFITTSPCLQPPYSLVNGIEACRDLKMLRLAPLTLSIYVSSQRCY